MGRSERVLLAGGGGEGEPGEVEGGGNDSSPTVIAGSTFQSIEPPDLLREKTDNGSGGKMRKTDFRKGSRGCGGCRRERAGVGGGGLRVNCSKGQGGKEMMESLLEAVGGLFGNVKRPC